MSINERQNYDHNIKKLAAQRQLYSDAKNVFHLKILVSVLTLLILGLAGNLVREQFAIYLIIISIVGLLVNEILLSNLMNNLKKEAANIQELFDCEVLVIPLNSMKTSSNSSLELINKMNKKYISKGGSIEELKNWYSGIEEADDDIRKVICQNTNCSWNVKLLQRYSNFLIVITSVSALVLLIISVYQNLSLASFITSVLAPILPLAILSYNLVSSSRTAISRTTHIKTKLTEIIDKMTSNTPYNHEHVQKDIRSLQDLIFDNRSQSPLVPNTLYRLFKDKDENLTILTNKDIIALKKSKNS